MMMRAADRLQQTVKTRSTLLAVVAVFAVIALVEVAPVAACKLSGCPSSSTFCQATAHGATAQAAITSYVRICGSNYSIGKGPYDADKAASGDAAYARVVEYTVDVKSNSEGSLAFLMVGQRAVGTSWGTLGPPGPGP